jgi:predicted nucleic acid-binding Zn ribbon protein
MKRSNTQPLKEVIQEYLEALKMNQKLREVSMLSKWESTVGRTIARATKDIYIKDRKLFVVLNSSVIRNELMLIKEPLVKRLNDDAKAQVVDELVLL